MSSEVTDRAAGTRPEAPARQVTAERFDLDAWRGRATDRLLFFVSVLGAILILSSVVQAIGQPQWWSETVPFLVAYGLVLALALSRRLWRRWIDYRIPAWGLLLVGYAAAVVYLALLGLLGNGLLMLVALPAVGLVLLGRRSGVALVLLSLAIYAFFVFAAATGLLAGWLIIRENALELAQWLSQGLSAGLVLVVLISLLTRFLVAQVAALAGARAATQEMAQARDSLQARTEALDRYSHLLETAAEISRRVSTVRAGGDLLQKAADLMVRRLDVRRVTVYFVDEDAAAGSSPAGSRSGDGASAAAEAFLRLRPGPIAAGEGEPLVSPVEAPPQLVAAVGRAAAAQKATSQAVVVNGASSGAGQSPAGDAPEVALLLRAGGTLSAVLHLDGVTSLGAQTGEEEMAALEVMADQLAGALENARVFEEAEARLRELGALQRHYTVAAWQRFMAERGKTAYHWMPLGAPAATTQTGRPDAPGRDARPEALEEAWRSLFERARAEGRAVNVLDEDSGRHLLAMPVRLRDEAIGMLGFHRPRDAGAWQQEEIAAIEVVASRMAFAAENLRLLEDAQRRAARDQLAREVVENIRSAVTMEDAVRRAIREMGRALGASQVVARIGPESELLPETPLRSEGDPATGADPVGPGDADGGNGHE